MLVISGEDFRATTMNIAQIIKTIIFTYVRLLTKSVFPKKRKKNISAQSLYYYFDSTLFKWAEVVEAEVKGPRCFVRGAKESWARAKVTWRGQQCVLQNKSKGPMWQGPKYQNPLLSHPVKFLTESKAVSSFDTVVVHVDFVYIFQVPFHEDDFCNFSDMYDDKCQDLMPLYVNIL